MAIDYHTATTILNPRYNDHCQVVGFLHHDVALPEIQKYSKLKYLQESKCYLLTHFKRKFYSIETMLKLDNQLLTLKKGSMFIDFDTNSFIGKIEYAQYI